QLANFKLTEVGDDAREALRLRKDLPDAHGLQGFTLLLQSRVEPTAAGRIDLVRKCLKSYDEALRLLKDQKGADPAERAEFLTSPSTACVELANYLFGNSATRAEMKQLLLQARDDAEQAKKIDGRRFPDWAAVALGHALEDLAWMAQEGVPGNYLAAMQE